jgi:hypothetical protein
MTKAKHKPSAAFLAAGRRNFRIGRVGGCIQNIYLIKCEREELGSNHLIDRSIRELLGEAIHILEQAQSLMRN